MDEDWDNEGETQTSSNNNFGVVSEGGRKFTAGRGFKPVQATDGDWGSSGTAAEDSGWGNDDFQDNSRGFGGGGFRGDRRGRGGDRRGSRGGRGGFRSRENGDFDDDGGGFGDGERRGRGGFRGGRGGRGGFSNGDYDDDSGGFGDGERRGRGGGRGGRGGRGGFSNGNGFKSERNGFDDENEEEGPPKPKEHYIPVERTTDEELFTSGISSGVNFLKLHDIEVQVSGENPPQPITSFEDSGLRPHLINNVLKSGYTKPTPIQKYSIPIILGGRDLMGCAQTGSGKTAAFLLPIINYLMQTQEAPVVENSCAQPNVVIVSPTRELTIQIFEQAKKFSHSSIVKVVEAYGGTSTNHQRSRVLNGCHILVATPGRLNDFVKRNCVSFESVKFFVLDEADRMLDMGFLPAVEEMLGHASMTATGERQTLMFSATFPEEIQHLAGKFLHNYVFITVGIVGSASTDVEQTFMQVSKFEKRPKLLELLKEDPKMRTLVFVETKRNADFLAAFLSENDIKTTSIHGDRLQKEREQALWDFKKGFCPVMVATGVAARGLDIEGVQHVINFDLPNSVDEYVHRIGRTGRVGNRGKATSFFDPTHDAAQASQFSKVMKQAGQKAPEWLSSGNFDVGGGQPSFGGRDIRGDDFGRAQQNVADEEEEVW